MAEQQITVGLFAFDHHPNVRDYKRLIDYFTVKYDGDPEELVNKIRNSLSGSLDCRIVPPDEVAKLKP